MSASKYILINGKEMPKKGEKNMSTSNSNFVNGKEMPKKGEPKLSASEPNSTEGKTLMANGIKKERESSIGAKAEKIKGKVVDAADQQQPVACDSPGVPPYRHYVSVPRRFSMSDSSSDSSGSSHTWDHKRRGVNNKKLHKMRAAAKRTPEGRPHSPQAKPMAREMESPPSTPSSASGEEAGLDNRISPGSKRMKVSSSTSKLNSFESGAPNSGPEPGSDTNRKRLESFKKKLLVVNEQIAKKCSELTGAGSRHAPGTTETPRGGSSSANTEPAADPKKSPEQNAHNKIVKK